MSEQQRAQPTRTVTAAVPIVSQGKPVLPRHLGHLASGASVQVGPGHLRAIAPHTGAGDSGSGHTGNWTHRWSVDTLPDPKAHGGYYWLGERSGQDGTLSLPAGAAQWQSDDGKGPAWHSRFPFKPSVAAIDHYVFGGDIVHHPRGVNFNSHFIEHMWLDMGSRQPQPFTWVFAAMVTAWQFDAQRHFLLDSGRDPRALHVPDYSIGNVYTPRGLGNEGLNYRSMLGINRESLLIRSREPGGQVGRVASHPTLRPKMYVGIFDGARSAIGVYTPASRKLARVRLDANPAVQLHRYYVLGRRFGTLSQHYAGSLMVFEARYWRRALSEADLKQQYHELAGSYHFNRYARS